jgi:hypothetical protein
MRLLAVNDPSREFSAGPDSGREEPESLKFFDDFPLSEGVEVPPYGGEQTTLLHVARSKSNV